MIVELCKTKKVVNDRVFGNSVRFFQLSDSSSADKLMREFIWMELQTFTQARQGLRELSKVWFKGKTQKQFDIIRTGFVGQWFRNKSEF